MRSVLENEELANAGWGRVEQRRHLLTEGAVMKRLIDERTHRHKDSYLEK